MSKNIIKGTEKCLAQECIDCELGGRIWMCNERTNLQSKERLEEMINAFISQDCIEDKNKVLNVILTFVCLGIISEDESKEYINKLYTNKVII